MYGDRLGSRVMMKTTPPDNLNLRIKPRAPYETAQIFCERRAGKANKAVIRYRNTWYLWTGRFYRKLDTENVRAELWKFLADALVREKRVVPSKVKTGRPKRNG